MNRRFYVCILRSKAKFIIAGKSKIDLVTERIFSTMLIGDLAFYGFLWHKVLT